MTLISAPKRFSDFLNEISQKWQKAWEDIKLFEANPDYSRKKFYTTVAFPYPNSPFHLGHGRTYVTCDIYARFMRMRGYNVLFPMGFHYTGTPIIAMADDVAKGDKELIDIFKNIYEIPDDVISKLVDPLFMANYFKEEIKKAMKEIGLSIDWRREFTTIDPEFSSFIVWQFNKLQQKGFIVRDTHPVGWCPVHHIPVGMHDTKGDMEPEIGEFTLIYFDSDLGIFPAATLRPETVFGAVAIWVNPDVNYAIVEIDGKKYVMSERAAFKISFQIDNVKTITTLKGSELTKHNAVNPITGKTIPILGADFVDPMTGTGVVMSVPAHAPFDYYYLKKIKQDMPVISIITVEGQGDALAKEVVDKTNPKGKEDLEKLTEQVYRTEYNKGRMKENIVELARPEFRESVKGLVGLSVPDARQKITEFLIEKKLGRKIYEIMNRPVYCRCGNEVVVKILKDQWFLDYGNLQWKALAKKLISNMTFIPPEARKDFEFVADWLQKRACARTRGLGTPLPWDKKWIIESLSDSTIYMAYYTVAHLIKKYGLKPSQLTLDFWDYVMLGQGDPFSISNSTGIPKEVIEEMRKEFTYWYPLDVRHSGKDLIPNHLSFFIFNHAAIFPEELWPKAIAVNGFVLLEGKKMSKSLRNIIPLRKAIRMYGADVVRITLTSTADMGSDVNFSDSYAKSVADALRNYYDLIEKVDEFKGSEESFPEKWIKNKFNQMVINVTKYLENLDLRNALNELLYNFSSYLNEYTEMVRAEGKEPNGKLVKEILEVWIKMISPFAPHFAEEVWHKLGHETFVSVEKWPEIPETSVDMLVDLIHEYHKKVLEDIQSILNVYKGTPKVVRIFVATPHELSLLRSALEVVSRGGSMKEFIEKNKTQEKFDAKLYQKIFEEARSLDDKMRKLVLGHDFNEEEILREGANYLKYKLGGKEIEIRSVKEMDKSKYKKDALPLKPAIFIQ